MNQFKKCGSCGKYPFCEFVRSANTPACNLYIPREKSNNKFTKLNQKDYQKED